MEGASEMDEEKALTTTEEKLPETGSPNKEVFKNEFDIGSMLPLAGSVKLSPVQKKILYAEIDENDVEIKPTGIIYLPWVHYVKRLHEAFGMERSVVNSISRVTIK
jgi:hypothetical protein